MNPSDIFRKIHTARRLSPEARALVIREQFEKSAPVLWWKQARTPYVARAYHQAYYEAQNTWMDNRWMGHAIAQSTVDLQIYQELIAKTCPAFIVQTGVNEGGSALFLSHMLDLIGAPATALVVAVDIEIRPKAKRVQHPRIRFVEGDSTAPKTIEQVRALVCSIEGNGGGGMVSLDSDHAYTHVAREITLYSPFVGLGQYLVVEDTNLNGHPVLPHHGPGPREAANEFLQCRPNFERDDAAWSRHMFSFHQGGWLRRIK